MSHYKGAVPGSGRKGDWRDAALCRKEGENAEDWFPVGATPAAKSLERHAKAVCHRCPSLQQCGLWALQTRQEFGVWGGMTEAERRTILRRRKAEADSVQPQPTPPRERTTYTSLRALYTANITRIIHGHLAWTGPAKPHFKGRSFNPKQVAFIVDRGRQPVGRVLTTCSVSGCVQPAHIADDEERAQCGTRAGYRRHLKNGETPCDACRDANTDADNRLRRTGTTKAAA